MGALLRALGPVLRSEELVQQSVCGLAAGGSHRAGILRDVDKAEILFLSARF